MKIAILNKGGDFVGEFDVPRPGAMVMEFVLPPLGGWFTRVAAFYVGTVRGRHAYRFADGVDIPDRTPLAVPGRSRRASLDGRLPDPEPIGRLSDPARSVWSGNDPGAHAYSIRPVDRTAPVFDYLGNKPFLGVEAYAETFSGPCRFIIDDRHTALRPEDMGREMVGWGWEGIRDLKSGSAG